MSRLIDVSRFTLVTAVMALAMAQPAVAQELPNFHVLAIGINKYKDPSIPQLRGASHDVAKVVELFKKQATRVTVTTLLDEEATQANIFDAINNLKKDVKTGDFVVVYLSGHGMRGGGHWTYVTYDYDRRRRNSGIYGGSLSACAIDLTGRGHHVLIAIDACYAGEVRRTYSDHFNSDNISFPNLENGARGGVILLASCLPSQTSRDLADNGLFTKALLRLLGSPDNLSTERNNVTIGMIRRRLNYKMEEQLLQIGKLPGMNRSEQDCIVEYSNLIPETLALEPEHDLQDLAPPVQGTQCLGLRWVHHFFHWASRKSVLNKGRSGFRPCWDRRSQPCRVFGVLVAVAIPPIFPDGGTR